MAAAPLSKSSSDLAAWQQSLCFALQHPSLAKLIYAVWLIHEQNKHGGDDKSL
jgi:hypothetical protein